MRILLAHTEALHPDTLAALNREMAAEVSRFANGESSLTKCMAEMTDVTGDDFAYWRAIKERWDGQEDLLIVEQDVVIHDGVIPQLAECPGDWCLFAYPIFNSGQRLTQGLGCTRFSAALQRRVDCAEFETDGKLYSDGKSGVPWNFLDLIIAERLKVGYGLLPHVHEPDVEHRHDYGGPVVIGTGLADSGRMRENDPLAVYHYELPVIFGPPEAVLKPAVMVYGATMTDVNSLDDAARLANSLAARYMTEDGKPRETPAQLDTSRPQALRFKTDKVSQGYLPAYLRIAGEIGTSGRVCEVGVWGGDSLHMWQALFPGGIAAGIDNDERATWPAGTVKIVASQDDESLPGQLRRISPAGWDLIVDDASHDGVLTRKTWELLWPLVVPGGRYVIEDWFVGLPSRQAQGYGESMLRTAESFLLMLDRPGGGRLLEGQVESAEYRHGMIILRKAG